MGDFYVEFNEHRRSKCELFLSNHRKKKTHQYVVGESRQATSVLLHSLCSFEVRWITIFMGLVKRINVWYIYTSSKVAIF